MTANLISSNCIAPLIPDRLQNLDHWVCWRYIEREGDKPGKMPIDPTTGKRAKVNDKHTWASFQRSVDHTQQNGSVDGIGFVFTTDDPYIGVDLDNCVNQGDLQERASDIVASLDSYTELSPSRTGIHIITEGTAPESGIRQGDIEAYDSNRYFTVTGLHYEGTPRCINRRDQEIETVYNEYLSDESKFGEETAVTTGGVGESDCTPSKGLSNEQVLEKATQAANREKFERLWSGITTGYQSHSEADLALCCILAFWTGGDPQQTDQLFRKSALYREKWDEPRGNQTYGARTVAKAVHETEDFYAN